MQAKPSPLNPAQLVEVAQYVRKRDGVSHVVLASGTGDPLGSEIPYLARCAEALKTATGLPFRFLAILVIGQPFYKIHQFEFYKSLFYLFHYY